MVEELHAVAGHDFTGVVEDSGSRAAGLLVKVPLVGNPGAADIFQPQSLGVTRHRFRIVAEPFEGKVHADAFDAARSQHRRILLGRQFVGAVQLGVFKAEPLDFVQ